MSSSLLEHVACNLCGADQPVVIYPSSRNSSMEIPEGEFRSSGDVPLKDPLVRCGVCGFKYVNPRLDSSLVLKGYTTAVDETFVSQAKGRELTSKRCIAEVQLAWGKPPGNVFDVGTANGAFLKVARDAGWEVAGCEPSRWMCEWCKTNYDIEITPGTIRDSNLGNETVDIITLWDVLEHTPDPMDTIMECVRILRPGGLLVVNYPDIDSWIARLMGRKWVFLLSVHYYYFTRWTICRAMEMAGLGVITMKPHFQTLGLDYVLFRSTAYIGAFGKIMRLMVQSMGLGEVQIPYWMGQTLVIAQKKGLSVL